MQRHLRGLSRGSIFHAGKQTAASAFACIRRRQVSCIAAATPSSSNRPPIPGIRHRAPAPGAALISLRPGPPSRRRASPSAPPRKHLESDWSCDRCTRATGGSLRRPRGSRSLESPPDAACCAGSPKRRPLARAVCRGRGSDTSRVQAGEAGRSPPSACGERQQRRPSGHAGP